jgi:hypothetical protein
MNTSSSKSLIRPVLAISAATLALVASPEALAVDAAVGARVLDPIVSILHIIFTGPLMYIMAILAFIFGVWQGVFSGKLGGFFTGIALAVLLSLSPAIIQNLTNYGPDEINNAAIAAACLTEDRKYTDATGSPKTATSVECGATPDP